MERSLSRLEAVGVSVVDTETGSPVVEEDPGVACPDPGSDTPEVGLDERYPPIIPVDHAHVRRAAQRATGVGPGDGRVGSYPGGPVGEACRVEETRRVETGESGIGGQVVSFPHHRPVGLDEEMPPDGLGWIVGRGGLDEDEEGGQGQVSLGVGGHGPGCPAVDPGAYRSHPLRLVGGQVLAGDPTVHRLRDGIGDGSPVETSRPLLGDDLQGAGHPGTSDDLPRPGWRAPGIHLGPRRMAGEIPGGEGPAQLPRRRESVVGQTDGRNQQVRQRHPSEPPGQLLPAGDTSRHRHAEGVERRDAVFASELVEVGVGSGRPAGVDGVGGLDSGLMDQGEQVASDPAGLRCDHTLHGVHRDRRIHRVSARGQHVHAGLDGQ